MKRFLFSCLILSCIPLVLISQDERLVATNYPGSVRDMFSESPGSTVFYTKDGYEKVKSYFEQVYGKARENGDKNNCFVKVESEEDKEDTLRRVHIVERGVTVRAKPRKDNYFVAQAMAQMQSAYIARFSGTSTQDKMRHANDVELQNELQKYIYLKRSFYLRVNNNGTAKGIEEILYDKFFASAEEVRERKMNELMDEYTRLLAEGDMAAASKVSEKMNSLSKDSVETTDKWEIAKTYLKELEKLAFATKIVIDHNK